MLTEYATKTLLAGGTFPTALTADLIVSAASGQDVGAALMRALTGPTGTNATLGSGSYAAVNVPGAAPAAAWTGYSAQAETEGAITTDTAGSVTGTINAEYTQNSNTMTFAQNPSGSGATFYVQRVAWKDGAGKYWLVNDAVLNQAVPPAVAPQFVPGALTVALY